MLRPATIQDVLKPSNRKYGRIRFEIEAFASSDEPCAEIDASRYASANVCAGTWRKSVERCGLEHEIVIVKNDERVFIAHAWAL